MREVGHSDAEGVSALRRLHIGGHVRSEGWEVLDANAGPAVDHVGDARDLGRFEAATFAAVYASHVLEHFDYKDELSAVLREWHRVLEPGGTLYVSVPNLDVLASLFVLKEQLTIEERFMVMRMIFGGHVDKWDYHLAGLDADFLAYFLGDAGFVDLQKVATFGLFEDTSAMLFKGVPISLNVTARKPDG
jgi:predicted SAM-dependent methyltransferase